MPKHNRSSSDDESGHLPRPPPAQSEDVQEFWTIEMSSRESRALPSIFDELPLQDEGETRESGVEVAESVGQNEDEGVADEGQNGQEVRESEVEVMEFEGGNEAESAENEGQNEQEVKDNGSEMEENVSEDKAAVTGNVAEDEAEGHGSEASNDFDYISDSEAEDEDEDDEDEDGHGKAAFSSFGADPTASYPTNIKEDALDKIQAHWGKAAKEVLDADILPKTQDGEVKESTAWNRETVLAMQQLSRYARPDEASEFLRTTIAARGGSGGFTGQDVKNAVVRARTAPS